MEICLYATQSGTNGKIEPLTDILGNKVVKVFSNPSFRKIGNSEMPGNFRRNKPIIQKKFVFWVKRQRSINSFRRQQLRRILNIKYLTIISNVGTQFPTQRLFEDK